MTAYGKFSYIYDKLMYDCDYDKWSQYLISEVNGRGVDLAAGSGNITIPLKKAGLDVFGVDLSEEMLLVAAKKTREEGVRVNFIQGDMVKFISPHKLNFAVCCIDGVNYLKTDKLDEFFKNVYANLAEKGKFIFDISSYYKLTEIVGNNFFYDDEENVTYLWTNTLAKDLSHVTYDVAFFVKENDLYRRFDERHVLYAHKTKDVYDKLLQVGFKEVKILGQNLKSAPKEKETRIVFNATK